MDCANPLYRTNTKRYCSTTLNREADDLSEAALQVTDFANLKG